LEVHAVPVLRVSVHELKIRQKRGNLYELYNLHTHIVYSITFWLCIQN